MERLAIEVGVVIVVFLIGYKIGFNACFEYLSGEIEKEIERLKHGKSNRNRMGSDKRMG